MHVISRALHRIALLDVDGKCIRFTLAVVSADSIVCTVGVRLYRVTPCTRAVQITCVSTPQEVTLVTPINCITPYVTLALLLTKCQ